MKIIITELQFINASNSVNKLQFVQCLFSLIGNGTCLIVTQFIVTYTFDRQQSIPFSTELFLFFFLGQIKMLDTTNRLSSHRNLFIIKKKYTHDRKTKFNVGQIQLKTKQTKKTQIVTIKICEKKKQKNCGRKNKENQTNESKKNQTQTHIHASTCRNIKKKKDKILKRIFWDSTL